MRKPRIITIELNDIGDINELHVTLQRELNLPAYYGRNWGAFYDCVLNLSPRPEEIIFNGWPDFTIRFPEESKKMEQCLRDLSEELKARL